MEKTNIRVGSEAYEKLYGSRGLSTLKDKNVRFDGSKIRFTFTGKKGVKHDISIRSKKLAKIVRRCREIPGEELFQYFDENDEAQVIGSGDVNDYIREIAGEDFTSKDFRTWEGSVECIKVFKETGFGGSKSRIKKIIVSAIDKVAESLGNTRSICKKYYIHPLIFTAYENGQLEDYVNQIKKGSKWMECEERILMKILK
jgi:DNA topoisomerase-1